MSLVMTKKGIILPRFLAELLPFRFVLWQLVVQHLTLKYRRTALGFVWTLVNPLLNMAVTAVVFSMIMKFPLKGFALFLFAGMIPWLFVNSCVTQAGMAVIQNEGLIKKVYIPRHLFPVSVTTALLIETLLSAAALFLLAIPLGAKFAPALLFLPVAFALLYVFCLGLSLLFSVLFVYFRDMQQITGVLMQAIYYLTPIIYPISVVPPRYTWMLRYNPLTYFIDLFRDPIYGGVLPHATTILTATGIALAVFATGWRIFSTRANDLVFRL